jgi:hypothetical protein
MSEARWSLYVKQSGHDMYRKVVNICTAQWSIYVPHSCQCVPHNGHYVQRSLTFSNSTFFPHSVLMCFVWN